MKRRNSTGSSRVPSRFAHRARPVRQYPADATSSRLLPPSPPTRGSGFLQLHPATATARRRGPFTPVRSNSASWRTTIITTLLDHEAAPADAVRDTYQTRWSASETTFGEDKTTITGAGNRTSGPVLRSGSPRLVISEAWAWLTATQLTRAGEAAALRGGHAAARALRRKDTAPVTADGESFTAARHHMIRSMTSTQVTATSSLDALAAAADAAARACLHTLNVPGRQRHSRRAQKGRPKFPHATATKTTVTGKPQVTVFAPGFCLAACRYITLGGTAPPAGAAGRGTARQPRRDTRVPPMPADRQHRHENRLKNR